MKFSIVMPCYNAEKDMPQAIAGVLSQSYADWELILVDDCSTDGSLAIARHYAQSDPRIRSVALDRNAGPSGARNAGLGQASGDWIALLDADDAWQPDRLAHANRHIATHDLDLFVDNLVFRSAAGTLLGCAFRPSAAANTLTFRDVVASEMPLQRFRYGFLKPFLRRAFLLEHAILHDQTVRHSEDFLLLSECLLKGGRARLSHFAGYIYTVPTRNRASASTQHMDETLRQRRHVAARVIALTMARAKMFDRHVRRLEEGRRLMMLVRARHFSQLRLSDLSRLPSLLVFGSTLPTVKKWTRRDMQNRFRP
jgi:succinoglycan biosynthesis protein ExoO